LVSKRIKKKDTKKRLRIFFKSFPSVIRLGATTRSKKAGEKTNKQTIWEAKWEA
jgi:hypothetical protein